MPDIVPLSSPYDDRLRDFTQLTDVQLRRRWEPAAGLFLAEGELVIRRAVHAGYRTRSMLLSEKWLSLMRPLAEEADAPVYVLGEDDLEQLTGFHVHRGALASMERKPPVELGHLLSSCTRLAVLEDVNSHTNLGAILRSAAALGVDGVLLSPRCADPLYRRSVRVSMGAALTIPWARASRWPGDLADVTAAGFAVLALTPSADAAPLDALDRFDRVALMLGAEGSGLSDAALAASSVPVRIPMSGSVDSLNVAAAAAVAFYALQRSAPSTT